MVVIELRVSQKHSSNISPQSSPQSPEFRFCTYPTFAHFKSMHTMGKIFGTTYIQCVYTIKLLKSVKEVCVHGKLNICTSQNGMVTLSRTYVNR